MNILPHKSWHVRTKKNIARVRKDEAKAAEEEKEKQRRIALAVQEDRTRFLRARASQRLGAPVPGGEGQIDDDAEAAGVGPANQPALALTDLDLTQQNGHINFFQEIEEGTKLDGAANKEHEEEKKKEQEEYEKKVGYLVYLGQNSLEHSKDKMWYERIERGRATKPAPTSSDDKSSTIAEKDQELADMKLAKLKDFQDPLKDVRKYLSAPGLKSEKDAKAKASSQIAAAKRKIPEVEPLVSKKKPRKDKKKHKEKRHKSSKHKHSKHKKKKSKSKKHEKQSDNSDSAGNSDSGESESEDEDAEALKKKQKLEQLRTERLERERIERRKAQALIEQIKNPGGGVATTAAARKSQEEGADVDGDCDGEGRERGRRPQLFPIAKQKYNSQFNPHLARQNFDN